MGPYCNFCNQRCFVHLINAPAEAIEAYGTSSIIATCRAGQRFEKDRVGWCYADIEAWRKNQPAEAGR